MHTITLQHSTDTAHRIVGHEGKCARLHGHTYGWEISVESHDLTKLGFVCDFATIKDTLNAWDHRTLLWDDDPLHIYEPQGAGDDAQTYADGELDAGVIRVPFNPTAEAMAGAACDLLARAIIIENPGLCSVRIAVAETPKSLAFAELHVSAANATELRRPPIVVHAS